VAFLFEKLDAYQQALQFAERIIQIIKSSRDFAVNDQLKRAAMSIPANIAEGSGRWHNKDKIHFFRIALGSAHECAPFLHLLKIAGVINHEQHSAIHSHLERVGCLINGLIRSTANRPQ